MYLMRDRWQKARQELSIHLITSFILAIFIIFTNSAPALASSVYKNLLLDCNTSSLPGGWSEIGKCPITRQIGGRNTSGISYEYFYLHYATFYEMGLYADLSINDSIDQFFQPSISVLADDHKYECFGSSGSTGVYGLRHRNTQHIRATSDAAKCWVTASVPIFAYEFPADDVIFSKRSICAFALDVRQVTNSAYNFLREAGDSFDPVEGGWWAVGRDATRDATSSYMNSPRKYKLYPLLIADDNQCLAKKNCPWFGKFVFLTDTEAQELQDYCCSYDKIAADRGLLGSYEPYRHNKKFIVFDKNSADVAKVLFSEKINDASEEGKIRKARRKAGTLLGCKEAPVGPYMPKYCPIIEDTPIPAVRVTQKFGPEYTYPNAQFEIDIKWPRKRRSDGMIEPATSQTENITLGIKDGSPGDIFAGGRVYANNNNNNKVLIKAKIDRPMIVVSGEVVDSQGNNLSSSEFSYPIISPPVSLEISNSPGASMSRAFDLKLNAIGTSMSYSFNNFQVATNNYGARAINYFPSDGAEIEMRYFVYQKGDSEIDPDTGLPCTPSAGVKCKKQPRFFKESDSATNLACVSFTKPPGGFDLGISLVREASGKLIKEGFKYKNNEYYFIKSSEVVKPPQYQDYNCLITSTNRLAKPDLSKLVFNPSTKYYVEESPLRPEYAYTSAPVAYQQEIGGAEFDSSCLIDNPIPAAPKGKLEVKDPYVMGRCVHLVNPSYVMSPPTTTANLNTIIPTKYCKVFRIEAVGAGGAARPGVSSNSGQLGSPGAYAYALIDRTTLGSSIEKLKVDWGTATTTTKVQLCDSTNSNCKLVFEVAGGDNPNPNNTYNTDSTAEFLQYVLFNRPMLNLVVNSGGSYITYAPKHAFEEVRASNYPSCGATSPGLPPALPPAGAGGCFNLHTGFAGLGGSSSVTITCED